MEQPATLETLRDLQTDLIAWLDSRLSDFDRLATELQSRIDDFRRVLDRKRRSEQSRKIIRDAVPDRRHPEHGSVIELDGAQFAITEPFKEAIYQVADELDLDELDATRLCLAVQETIDIPDDSLAYLAILRFQETRQTLLTCLWMVLRKAADAQKDDEDGTYEFWSGMIRQVILDKSGQHTAFWNKCLSGLSEVEQAVHKTQEQLQAMLMTGRSAESAQGEALRIQRMRLTLQHEALAAIICYLIRTRNVSIDNYAALVQRAAAADSPLDLLAHYAPPLISGATYFGAGDVLEDSQADDIYKKFDKESSQLQWKHPEFKAAASIWWLVEYSARHSEAVPALQQAKVKDAADQRHDFFFDCLARKGFHFMLTIMDFLKPEVWHDPTKAQFIEHLLDNTIQFSREAVAASPDFARLTMEEIQNFAEALISYMPDVLRQLKTDEDEKRRNFMPNNDTMYEMHLERFLLILAYAFQDDVDAAREFWNDSESNLYGFLRWMSRRLPTPRVAAFCELMRALVSDEVTADHAHQFLLEESSATGSRSRKVLYSISWTQIFNELEIYASPPQDRSVVQPVGTVAISRDDPDLLEVETPIMLEAYLRLTSYVVRRSPRAREWILRGQSFRLHDTVLRLAQTTTTAAVQACCLDVLTALLTDKTADINDGVWMAVDNWVSAGSSATASGQRLNVRQSEKLYLQRLSGHAVVATAFVNLLTELITPSAGTVENALDTLPFPDQLASAHRGCGINTYVDFVLGQTFLTQVENMGENDRMQLSVLQHACLQFVRLCLETFNEHLVDLCDNKTAEAAVLAKMRTFDTYARLHPFARAMEYLLNDRVVATLLSVVEQNPDELRTLPYHSPLVQAAFEGIQVIKLALNKHSTFSILIRRNTTQKGLTVANPAVASFSELIATSLDLTLHLVSYAACEHIDLALESMQLLQDMSNDTKITGYAEGRSNLQDGHRLLSKIADRAEAIQLVFRDSFTFRIVDIEDIKHPLQFVKAKAILDFLQANLEVNSDRPNIAHSLLGFQCDAKTLSVAPDSLFSLGKSVFHYVAAAAATLYPVVDTDYMYWPQSIRAASLRLITTLASSALTKMIVLEELEMMDFLLNMQNTTTLASSASLWSGLSASDPSMLHQESATTLDLFVSERNNYLQYATSALQSVIASGKISIRDHTIAVLTGLGAGFGPEHSTPVFSLLDFFDLEIAAPFDAALTFLADINRSDFPVTGSSQYDIPTIKQLLTLKKRALWQNGTIKDSLDEQAVNDEILVVLSTLTSQNQYNRIQETRLEALESWTDLLSALVHCTKQLDFTQRALQIVIPRLDRSFRDNPTAAAQLAKSALILVQGIATFSESTVLTSGIYDRLCQVFKSCIRATVDSDTNLGLRDVCYRVSGSVISTISRSESSTHQHQLMHQLQDAGDRVVRVLSDDAFSDRGVTRVSSLLLLDSILSLSKTTGKSTAFLRALDKVNFVPVLVETCISSVATTFRESSVDLGSSLAYFHTAAALLLRLAQVPDGPQLILRSNFVSAIEDSGLFSTDPDIGLDVENPDALEAFYRLLSAIVRILVAIVVGRGPGDGSLMRTIRQFLAENRTSISSIFKLTGRQGMTQPGKSEVTAVADELARLMFVADFLEEDSASMPSSEHRFT